MITAKLILITVTIVMGLKIAMSEDMLLERLGFYFERKVREGRKVYDLFICPFCMNSLQSLTAYAFAFGLKVLPFEFNWQLVIRWPLVVMASSFISGNIWNLYETINQVKEKNKAETEYYERCNRIDELEGYEQQHN